MKQVVDSLITSKHTLQNKVQDKLHGYTLHH